MSEEIRKKILKDFQIKKFCLYGFLKNLKFFEPYLILYLMRFDINLFQIGILIAIREIIVNLFEIPSGIIADYYGRKKEMYFCFAFYIISFVFFFFTKTFFVAMLGMIFFGLGEAFRSGTHKAMIYTYLDHKAWQKEKTFVYGRTRSFSLIGSAISSALGIVLILSVPADRYIFLFSVVPYILDLVLIISYPNFLDMADKKSNASFKEMLSDLVSSFRVRRSLRNLLIEEGMAEATFSYIKDLVQPILELIIIGSGIVVISSLTADDNLKIVLGLIYAVLNLFGSFFSKKTYLIKGNKSSMQCLYIMHIALAGSLLVLALCLKSYLLVCVVYIFIYALHSMRKPLFVDEVDNHIEKSNRATVISASSQIKSLCLVVFAPILGFLANMFGIKVVMIILGIIFVVTIPMLRERKSK